MPPCATCNELIHSVSVFCLFHGQELAAEVKDLLAGTSIYLVGMMGR